MCRTSFSLWARGNEKKKENYRGLGFRGVRTHNTQNKKLWTFLNIKFELGKLNSWAGISSSAGPSSLECMNGKIRRNVVHSSASVHISMHLLFLREPNVCRGSAEPSYKLIQQQQLHDFTVYVPEGSNLRLKMPRPHQRHAELLMSSQDQTFWINVSEHHSDKWTRHSKSKWNLVHHELNADFGRTWDSRARVQTQTQSLEHPNGPSVLCGFKHLM